MWKDLPSENWAEMMEFWHCHKPEPHNHQSHEHLADRGYGANAGISAQDAVGFIDIMSFLFTDHDTTGLKVSYSPCYIVHVSSMDFFPANREVLFRWSGVPRRWPSRHRSFSMSWPSIQYPKSDLQRATISAHDCLFPSPGHSQGIECHGMCKRDTPPCISWYYMRRYFDLAYFSSQQYSSQPNAEPGSAQPQDGDMPRVQSASCAQCDTVIGLRETYKHAVRLFKWQVGCQTLRSVKAPSATECLAAALMATLSRSGSAKMVVLPISAGSAPVSSETVLHLWILNSNITYASTEAAGGVKTAIKLFYRTISRAEAERLLGPVASEIQDLTLAEGALSETIRQLEATNQLLPEEQRHHQNWNVGLLDRYEDNKP